MSLRSRLSISLAAGALLAAAAAVPAVANDDWDGNQSNQSNQSNQGNQGNQGNWEHHQQEHNPRLYKGVVTASTLNLRSAPTRGSQIIRTVHRGEIVSIFCKTPGQTIDGNPLWYLLTDGTWAWGAARYIDNIGAAPRWC
ncbi:SH3 domain-containing protein [Streptomyces sp. TLI_55]|uniref:SH3 domain-containing protein n=1 Tax=Streptomyces sp. TLI_55 TaxID=1938861 RepID=UPI000BDCBEE5|nr:SH3 domain-containing protein [Streptomyces sp. TLI_55]SNX64029.1 SH3 domain-containing protein [Streptomyces sp. TLI_55]